ncbi:MAG: diguanylate cyclase, partial [Chloroflexota bacterium]
TRSIREGFAFRHVSVWRRHSHRLEPAGSSGPTGIARADVDDGFGILGAALRHPGIVADSVADELDGPVAAGIGGRRMACAIPGSDGAWGVLLVIAADDAEPTTTTRDLLVGMADILGSVLQVAAASTALERRVHWAEAIGRVASDIGSRFDSDQLQGRLVDHAIAMFAADRGAVFLFRPDGSRETVASRGLSAAYLEAMGPGDLGGLTTDAVERGRPAFAIGFRDDARAADVRSSVVQEGYDTVCVAPLIDVETSESIGSLNVYHDRRHHWRADELDALARLAIQASVAIRSVRTYAQLATWAAQLQSIQQLGTRLNRLSDVGAIGNAIATELRDLIDYHNVRVYRQYGDDLIPVAAQGEGEYLDETEDQLRLKVGAGITGWVAAHRVAENLRDAAADPRADTIPGTERDVDESMILAPMVFEDDVLGVLVLSKLGLNRFSDDDLRLLVIYASFAAQAMAHADATQRLERQLQSRRDLLEITETILSTLDTTTVLESVADRLGELVGSDNIWIELVEDGGVRLVPVIARGLEAENYLEPFLPGETGIATWVMEHNLPVLLADQFDDDRVFVGPGGRVHGGLICVPLRGRIGAIGVLSIERLGEGRSFSEEEFELVALFAAQVSIAVQNARAHGAITRQAETDDLTGLRNHRSFRHELAKAVAAGEPFSLVMIDLDRFKLVNDSFGHEAGNAFLRAFATAIADASRETDLAFRYGGDEFVVLLPRTDATHVGPVADRIRGAFANVMGPTADMRSKGVHVEASAGVATYPNDGATPDDILLAADRACFMVKRDGGGRVATAEEGLALTDVFTLQIPTPIDTGP